MVGFCELDDEVHVFVSKKLSMPTINKLTGRGKFKVSDLIPKFVRVSPIKKKKTDVIETGEIWAQIDSEEYRPLMGGCEIAPKDKNWVGTAGCVIFFHKFRNLPLLGKWQSLVPLLKHFGLTSEIRPALITNSHVANWDVTKPEHGQRMVQPGKTGKEVGTLVWSSNMAKKGLNEFDVAVIELDPWQNGTFFQREIIKVGVPLGVRDIERDEAVHKYGRTSEYTQGSCLYRNVTINVNYGEWMLLAVAGVDMYSKISVPGDSGSVICSKKGNDVVGLLFAGNSKYTYAIPFKKICERIGVQLTDEYPESLY